MNTLNQQVNNYQLMVRIINTKTRAIVKEWRDSCMFPNSKNIVRAAARKNGCYKVGENLIRHSYAKPLAAQQVKIDTTAYDFEINEHSDYKNGFFYFDNDDMSVKISFVSDEYGNIESLGVTEATDCYGEPTYFSIASEEEYRAIADQIEPHLWGDLDSYDTNYDHGLRNSDFISDWA